MIDFETLGTTNDAAVVSLGAVIFDAEGIKKEKLWLFNLTGQLDSKKRFASGDTITWWLGQGAAAKSVFEKAQAEGILLRDFVPQFLEFCQGHDLCIWGNGATFDIPIIEHILSQFNTKPPWKFWNHRCYRTMKSCYGIDRKFEGVKHDALDDAKHQANCLIEYWKENPGRDK